MNDAPPLLEVDGLSAGYGEVNILHEVSLAVRPGTLVAVIGPNGAGKSTLLKAIYGLLRPRGGRAVLRHDGRELSIVGRKPHQLTRLGLNYVPQLANVFPNMSVLENLQVGASTLRNGDERIERVLGDFPLLRGRRRQRAGTLSGGQRQMLALARALVTGPRLLSQSLRGAGPRAARGPEGGRALSGRAQPARGRGGRGGADGGVRVARRARRLIRTRSAC